MSDSLFDEAMPLDGMVGSFEDLEEAPPIPKGVLQVFVSGEAVSGSRTLGLTRDLEELIHTFVRRPASIGAEKTACLRRDVLAGTKKLASPCTDSSSSRMPKPNCTI